MKVLLPNTSRSPALRRGGTLAAPCVVLRLECAFTLRPSPCLSVSAAADTRRLVEEECKSSKVKPHPAFDPDHSIKPKSKSTTTPTTPIALVTFNSVDRCNDACTSLSGKLYGRVCPHLYSACSAARHLARSPELFLSFFACGGATNNRSDLGTTPNMNTTANLSPLGQPRPPSLSLQWRLANRCAGGAAVQEGQAYATQEEEERRRGVV